MHCTGGRCRYPIFLLQPVPLHVRCNGAVPSHLHLIAPHHLLRLTRTPLSHCQFLAEWGDRSQIATIALAAKNEPFGTTIGGIVGHALCTGAAVLGGKVLSEKISKKAVLFIGASEGAPFV